MNNNINNEAVVEDIDVGVETKTKNISLNIVMTSHGDNNFDFSTTIDELGQIVLTPLSNNVEFKTVEVVLEDMECFPESCMSSEDDVITKSFCLNLDTTLLSESDNHDVAAIVDDIGQVVIHPIETTTTFVSVAVGDSLNIVTEDLQCVDYFGYKLCNNGDGWDITDPSGESVEVGVATLPEAKVIVLTTELHLLESLTEDVEEQSSETVEDETVSAEINIDEIPSDVAAEVVSEELTEITYSEDEIEDALVTLTDMFKDTQGTIRCDTVSEQDICCDILSKHYSSVECHNDNGVLTISYSNSDTIVESTDVSKQEIINKFLQGELSLFSDEGEPQSSYIHLNELDANGYKYYYDEETGAIISYPDVD